MGCFYQVLEWVVVEMAFNVFVYGLVASGTNCKYFVNRIYVGVDVAVPAV